MEVGRTPEGTAHAVDQMRMTEASTVRFCELSTSAGSACQCGRGVAQDALAELAELGYITGDPLSSSRRGDKFALNGAGGRGKKRNGKNNARASR